MLAVVSLWLLLDKNVETASPPRLFSVDKASDYTMTHFNLTIMDETGQLDRIVYGKKLVHYLSDDSTHIVDQVTEFFEEGETIWTVSSDKGDTIAGNAETILLSGHVVVTDQRGDGVQLFSDTLHLNTHSHTAYTDTAVTIKTANRGETYGVGMDATLKDKIINLHTEVAGQYASPFGS